MGWNNITYPTPRNLNFGLFSQTSNSVIIANTTTESSLIGIGEGNLSVPENNFSVGDSFYVTMGGLISNLNNTDITFRLKSLGNTLVDTGLINLKSGTNQFWQLYVCFTIRNIGMAGVANIVSNGSFTHIRNNMSVDYFGFNTINNTTFDTTILNTLDITAQWATANVNNSIFSEVFVLNKIY